MKTWVKIALTVTLTVGVICFSGLEYWHLKYTHRMARIAARKQLEALTHPKTLVDPDSSVVLKRENPTTLKDEKDLKGQPLWVSAGGQMEYFTYSGKVDYSHPQGVLLGAEKITVKDAVEQAPPKDGTYKIPPADGHVLLVFTLEDNPGKEFAVPVGNHDGGDYNLLTDQLFFYDDPHMLYASWGPQMWQAIDAHQAIAGMSERQVRMALGQTSTQRAGLLGETNVEYANAGKPAVVTFVNGKVTRITDESR